MKTVMNLVFLGSLIVSATAFSQTTSSAFLGWDINNAGGLDNPVQVYRVGETGNEDIAADGVSNAFTLYFNEGSSSATFTASVSWSATLRHYEEGIRGPTAGVGQTIIITLESVDNVPGLILDLFTFDSLEDGTFSSILPDGSISTATSEIGALWEVGQSVVLENIGAAAEQYNLAGLQVSYSDSGTGVLPGKGAYLGWDISQAGDLSYPIQAWREGQTGNENIDTDGVANLFTLPLNDGDSSATFSVSVSWGSSLRQYEEGIKGPTAGTGETITIVLESVENVDALTLEMLTFNSLEDGTFSSTLPDGSTSTATTGIDALWEVGQSLVLTNVGAASESYNLAGIQVSATLPGPEPASSAYLGWDINQAGDLENPLQVWREGQTGNENIATDGLANLFTLPLNDGAASATFSVSVSWGSSLRQYEEGIRGPTASTGETITIVLESVENVDALTLEMLTFNSLEDGTFSSTLPDGSISTATTGIDALWEVGQSLVLTNIGAASEQYNLAGMQVSAAFAEPAPEISAYLGWDVSQAGELVNPVQVWREGQTGNENIDTDGSANTFTLSVDDGAASATFSVSVSWGSSLRQYEEGIKGPTAGLGETVTILLESVQNVDALSLEALTFDSLEDGTFSSTLPDGSTSTATSEIGAYWEVGQSLVLANTGAASEQYNLAGMQIRITASEPDPASSAFLGWDLSFAGGLQDPQQVWRVGETGNENINIDGTANAFTLSLNDGAASASFSVGVSWGTTLRHYAEGIRGPIAGLNETITIVLDSVDNVDTLKLNKLTFDSLEDGTFSSTLPDGSTSTATSGIDAVWEVGQSLILTNAGAGEEQYNLSGMQVSASIPDFVPALPAMMITGVMDGTIPGGLPKAIELYVYADIPDLSLYGVGSANNGGGSNGIEITLEGSALAGDYLYIASEETEFTNVWGFAPDFFGDAANINGDDAIELFLQEEVIDVFGEIDVDGTGSAWEYKDSWAYRTVPLEPDADGSFVIEDWTFGGVGALNGLDAAGLAAAVPFGYFPNPIPQPEPLPWEGASDGDIIISPWFGSFEVSAGDWLNHYELLWIYVGYVTSIDDMWIYSLFQDTWVWSDMDTWPWLFNSVTSSWVYYFNVPNVGVWEYDMSVAEWVFYPDGS